MAAWTNEELQQMIQVVRAKAATDPQFRQQVLVNPNAAIRAIAGKALPEGMSVQVVEADAAADVTIVLPPLQAGALSDQDLDHVAGGSLPLPPIRPPKEEYGLTQP